MSTTLSVRAVNHRRPAVKPSLTGAERAALAEAERLYTPYSVLRLFTTYFRAGPGAELHVGHGQYFDFDHVVSRLLDIPGLSTTYGSQVYGGGKGLDLFEAYVSSIGEGIERLLGSFAVFIWQDRLRYGSYRDLTGQGLTCLHPDEVPIFSAAQAADPQFGFDPWDEDSYLGWIPGHRLFGGEEVYVPAQLVLFIYYRQEEEPQIGLAPSGGLASHISQRQAVLHAVCELIERDAVNLRWHARVPLDRVVLDEPVGDAKLDRALARLRDGIGAPTFYYHNLDFEEFPVVTAVQMDRWLRRLAYNAGGGIGPTMDEAMRSALGEYCQSERSLRICQLTRNWNFSGSFESLFGIRPDATPDKFSRYVQAITYYGYAENAERTRWYFEGGPEIALSELHAREQEYPADPMERLRLALRTRDIDPIMFDFTPPGLRHTRLWKAFIAELSPPYPPSSPALGHPRYLTVPRAAGRAAVTDAADLLTDPLPYP